MCLKEEAFRFCLKVKAKGHPNRYLVREKQWVWFTQGAAFSPARGPMLFPRLWKWSTSPPCLGLGFFNWAG